MQFKDQKLWYLYDLDLEKIMEKNPFRKRVYRCADFEETSYVSFSSRSLQSQYLFQLRAFGETFAEKRWVRKKSGGSAFSLEYIVEGECIYAEGKVRKKLRQGDFFLFHEGRTGGLSSNPAIGIRKYYITLGYNLLLGRLYSLPQGQILSCRPRNPQLVVGLYEEIKHLVIEGGEHQESKLVGKVYQLYCELVQSAPINEFTDEYSEMLSAINSAPEQYPNLKTLSAEFKLSRYALTQFFGEKLKTTPMEYVITQRFNKACWHLENQITPVNVIANSCGFNNIPFFTSEFKKRFDMTPLEFRRKKQRQDYSQIV